MNSSTITVHWHDNNQPVYSVSFQPIDSKSPSPRLATGGGDNNIRIWSLGPQVKYLSTLRKHTQAVNSVRFSPDGSMLASAGDDGTVVIWSLLPTLIKEFGVDDDDASELWVAKLVLRLLTSEIYDIAWSPDGRYIAAGSMDHTVRIYDLSAGGNMVLPITQHSHYVQGLAWDPRGQYIASQLADRSVCVFELGFSPFAVTLSTKVAKAEVPSSRLSRGDDDKTTKTSQIYHSETLQSFFRRPAFSPDGNLLITPAGVYRSGDDEHDNDVNTTYVYIRSALNKPIAHLPGLKRLSVAIAFSPVVYQNTIDISPVFRLPYKMVFAVATQDAIVVYDTVNLQPLGMVLNIHYSTITDLAFDKDGQRIIVSSADGFCSVVNFDLGIFGSIYSGEFVKECTQTSEKKSEAKQAPVPETKQRKEEKVQDDDEVKEVAYIDLEAEAEAESPQPSVVNLLKKKEKKRVAPTLVG